MYFTIFQTLSKTYRSYTGLDRNIAYYKASEILELRSEPEILVQVRRMSKVRDQS